MLLRLEFLEGLFYLGNFGGLLKVILVLYTGAF